MDVLFFTIGYISFKLDLWSFIFILRSPIEIHIKKNTPAPIKSTASLRCVAVFLFYKKDTFSWSILFGTLQRQAENAIKDTNEDLFKNESVASVT